MKKGHLWAVFVVFLLVLAFPIYADRDLGSVDPEGYACEMDDECEEICAEEAVSCYCSEDTWTCWTSEGADESGGSDAGDEGDDSGEGYESDESGDETDEGTGDEADPGSDSETTPAVNARGIVYPTAAAAVAESSQLQVLQQRLSALETSSGNVERIQSRSANIEQRVLTLENTIGSVQQELNTIAANVQNALFQQKQNKDELKQDVNSVSTGMASLQDDLGETKSSLDDLDKELKEEKSSISLMKFMMFILGGLIIAVIIVFYVTKGKSSGPVKEGKTGGTNPQIADYITKHIKKGWKYPHIRASLLKAGWSQEDVDRTYKETMQRNYQQYLKAKGKSSSAGKQTTVGKKEPAKKSGKGPATGPVVDKNKMIAITVFSILIVIGIIFLLKGISAGKAIHIQESFEQGEIFECTPPHMVNEDSAGCCLDMNNNSQCDVTEAYEAKREEVVEAPSVCNDHVECPRGQKCIDNSCGILSSTACSEGPTCYFENVEIRTSDGETYRISGNKGSYTAAGSLAWTVLPLQPHCEGEELPSVKIEVVMNDLFCLDAAEQIVSCQQRNLVKKTKSMVVRKEIVTLAEGETSKPLIHPNPLIERKMNEFTLTVQRINDVSGSRTVRGVSSETGAAIQTPAPCQRL